MHFHFDSNELKSVWSKLNTYKIIGRVPHALAVFCNEPKSSGPVYRRKVILSPHVVLWNEEVNKV